jgi:hypothetical protein
MALIGQPRMRGFHSRLDSRSPSLSMLLLVHLRERAKHTNQARTRKLMEERLRSPDPFLHHERVRDTL